MKTNNTLTTLDSRIIDLLESDSRQNFQDIAAELGVSRAKIASRVQHLLDKGIINMFCWVDPRAIGYKYVITLFISAPGHIKAVADSLKDFIQIPLIHLCTGRFDIVALALIRETEDLSSFILNELDSIPGIAHNEKIIELQPVKSLSVILKNGGEEPYQKERMKDQVDLDDLDVSLMKELRNNTRLKTGYLARKFGVSQPTIYRRIQRLIKGNIVKMRVMVDPFALGYEGVAIIGLKCDPNKVEDVATHVAAFDKVLYVIICTGRYDITAWVRFRTLSDLKHFITNDIGCSPGVKDIETMISHKVVKMSLQTPM